MIDTNTILQEIDTERLRLGVSTKDLCALAGIKASTMFRIRNGQTQGRDSTYNKLKKALRKLAKIQANGI